MSGLQKKDLDAVNEAVEAVRAEGFDTTAVDRVEPKNHGVEFDVTLFRDTRTKPINPVAESFRSAVRETFADLFTPNEAGPAVVVTLNEGADADKWARLARKDDVVRGAEVVEADADNDEHDETPEKAAGNSFLDGGERVGTKRTDRGRDNGGDT